MSVRSLGRARDGPVCLLPPAATPAGAGNDSDDSDDSDGARHHQQGEGSHANAAMAAVVLSEWLGLAGGATGVRLLALLLRAGAALPRHVALLAAALSDDRDDGSDGRRLQAVQALGALPPSLVQPHLPLLAATIAQLLGSRAAGIDVQ